MIYLDSAATSMLKPKEVQLAVIEAMSTMASPGRGSHEAAMKAAGACYECRECLAELFNVSKPENIVFTLNATHALNIAINSIVKDGMRVLVSGYEHNSVMRPLYARNAQLTIIDTPLFMPQAFLKKAEEEIENVDVVVCTHVSNALGYILPIDALAKMCKRHKKKLIIDASQSAGVLPVNFSELDAEFIAMPGHKGLLGPQGTGVLICKNEATPLLYGGSGSASTLTGMPEYLPDRLEAGTHNVAGISGLCAGTNYILNRGADSIARHERLLLDCFAGTLGQSELLTMFYSAAPENQCGVISVVPNEIDCETFGEKLSAAGIAVRTGLHCSPLAHKTVGTELSGTVRFSFSPLLQPFQVYEAAVTCEKILKNN